MSDRLNFSGIYPNLAYYNNEGECGTGAVVPWANRLWVITYGPHQPFGSSDKLYEITPDLQQITRKESIGGTPANRLIHTESNQLFIGPYAIDADRNVRVIPWQQAPGRYTGAARHLTNPADKIYIGTMEEGFYEVDVKTLKTTMLYEDINVTNKNKKEAERNYKGALLPGTHGKGMYSGQGVLIYSNNGEPTAEALTNFKIKSGVLAEWNGIDWKVIRRNQFTEISGPGGIYGNQHPETDPIWTNGWDYKSLLIGVRDLGKWSFYRLPKASHSYDGAHGWNTEWPRIRNIGTAQKPDYLMTMHGMFWHFPGTFSSSNSAGIRPGSAYLKVIGDFTRWGDRLVFGCDDAATAAFLNKSKIKADLPGPGQSNSNIWFTSPEIIDQLGPNTSEGAVWLDESVTKSIPSEPFLFAGWPKRMAWIKNEGTETVNFAFEVDKKGTGTWQLLRSVSVEAGKSAAVEFSNKDTGEWVRTISDKNTIATVHFFYTANDSRTTTSNDIFKGLAKVSDSEVTGGLIYCLGKNRRVLGLSANKFSNQEKSSTGYYELDEKMNLVAKEDTVTQHFIDKAFQLPKKIVTIDESSILIIDDKGRRWRLPLGDDKYADLTNKAELRVCREVSTERDLLNCMGTFYELPAENADGFAKIRPIASHHFRINDYTSYRGMLIMTGINLREKNENSHIIVSNDGKAAVWAGVIDDLWKMGKPTGKGGPWKNASVQANEASDPYLIGFYDKRSLTLSHNSKEPVVFQIEVEPIGHGPWMLYKEVTVIPGKQFKYIFPADFQARWIRFKTNKPGVVTAWLDYK